MASTFTDRLKIHTDDYMGIPWADVPMVITKECKKHEMFVCEGVQVARCLRRGLEVDVVVWMERPFVALTPGQHTMAKGCRSIFDEWLRMYGADNRNCRVIWHR